MTARTSGSHIYIYIYIYFHLSHILTLTPLLSQILLIFLPHRKEHTNRDTSTSYVLINLIELVVSSPSPKAEAKESTALDHRYQVHEDGWHPAEQSDQTQVKTR